MILQQKGFCIMGDGKPVEIPLATCDPAMNESHIYVLELAFGPDSESSARGVSLWFNINESDVTTFTQAQAKRFRWKRSLKKEDKTNKPTSIFDTMDGFEMHRPTDSTAYELATDIMKHRVDVLTKERLVDMRERFEALEKLKEEKKVLQDRFEKIRRAWVKWAWPVNDGRDKVDKNTPVPKIDEKYEFKKDLPGEGAEAMGAATETIWGVFVTEDFVSEGATVSTRVIADSMFYGRLLLIAPILFLLCVGFKRSTELSIQDKLLRLPSTNLPKARLGRRNRQRSYAPSYSRFLPCGFPTRNDDQHQRICGPRSV